MRPDKRVCFVTKIESTRDAERDRINIFLYGTEHFGPVQAERYPKTLNAKIEMAGVGAPGTLVAASAVAMRLRIVTRPARHFDGKCQILLLSSI